MKRFSINRKDASGKYSSPEIRVFSLEVEKGFAASDGYGDEGETGNGGG